MSSPISSDLIISLFEYHLNINPDCLVVSQIRIGDFDESYGVKSDQGDFVLRLAPPDEAKFLFYQKDMMRREVDLLKAIRDQTTIPVPEIVAFDFGQHRVGVDYLIMRATSDLPYSEITSLSHAQHDRVYTQLGSYLRESHSITSSMYGYDASHPPLTPQPTWQQAFEKMWYRLVNDVVACGLYNDDEASSMITLLDTYKAYFDRKGASALLHMGMHKENIFVDAAGNVTGLVGFDRALWGDIELDFAVLDCAGIWASAFWKGYGQPRPNDLGSRTRRKFYILYEVQRNIPLYVVRYNNLEEAEQYKQTTMTIATNLVASDP